MVKNESIDRICEFCGKIKHVTISTEDGVDWLGYTRGNSNHWDDDKGCDCDLGKIAYNKTQIKQMCLNCKSYVNGYYTNN